MCTYPGNCTTVSNSLIHFKFIYVSPIHNVVIQRHFVVDETFSVVHNQGFCTESVCVSDTLHLNSCLVPLTARCDITSEAKLQSVYSASLLHTSDHQIHFNIRTSQTEV